MSPGGIGFRDTQVCQQHHVRVDVLEVRQIEIDQPSDDPGDRLHAFAHAWAGDSATEVAIEVAPMSGAHVEVSALVAEPARSWP